MSLALAQTEFPAAAAQVVTPLSDAEFKRALTDALPGLRVYGRNLTRDAERADDLAQETALKAWQARANFEAETNFRGWLYSILRNTHTSQMRRSGRMAEWDDIAAERIMATPPNQEDHIRLGEMEAMLGRLRPEQSDAIISMALFGQGFEEIAAARGAPVGTIKAQCARGREALRKMSEGIMSASQAGRTPRPLKLLEKAQTIPRILTLNKLKACMRAHYTATGEWPLARDEYIQYGPYAGEIKWSYVPDCLKNGMNGLPKGHTFQSLRKEVQKAVLGVEGTRSKETPLEIGKIKACMRAHFEATGQWPQSNQKGVIEYGPYKEMLRWDSVSPYLGQGKRGLPKGHTFTSLRDEAQREIMGEVARPPRGAAAHKRHRSKGAAVIAFHVPEAVAA